MTNVKNILCFITLFAISSIFILCYQVVPIVITSLHNFNWMYSKIKPVHSILKEDLSQDKVRNILLANPQIFSTLKRVYTAFVTDALPHLLIKQNSGAFAQVVWDISSNNEFLFIWNHMQASNSLPNPPSIGSVVELGGGSGIGGSNSFNFIQQGWHGLIVEPLPANAALIREQLFFFPLGTVLECAVDDHDGTATIFSFTGDGSSTTSCIECEDTAYMEDATRRFGTPVQSIVTVHKIDTLFQKNNIKKSFDVLSIDIEGREYIILVDMFAAKYFPRYVIVEMRFDQKNIRYLLESNGYVSLNLLNGVTINEIWLKR